MRIHFEFGGSISELPAEIKDWSLYSFWIEDFPCRLLEGDMVCLDVMPDEELLNKLLNKLSGYDHPEVDCCRFERDEKGIFQHVWLSL